MSAPQKAVSETVSAVADTPIMRQHADLKQRYMGYLLFFRLGDFYELFGQDAIVASELLQLTLTQRRSSKEQQGVPMCGVPFHAAEGYIAKLITAGHKVALCEQVETPEEAKKRGGAKALVRRDVTRLFTSGTLTEEAMLPSSQNNYLLAIAPASGGIGAAWLDLSTGEFMQQQCAITDLPALLARLNPAEIVTPVTLSTEKALQAYSARVTPLPEAITLPNAQALLAEQFTDLDLSVKATTLAAGMLLDYVQTTQLGKLPILQTPRVEASTTLMHIDASSQRNLELLKTLKGDVKGSVFSVIDQTCTVAGKRLLQQWLVAPLASLTPLQQRQQVVDLLAKEPRSRAELRDALRGTSDLGRALSRIALDRGGPRDLDALRQTLNQLPDLVRRLQPLLTASNQNALLKSITKNMEGFEHLAATLRSALQTDNLPLLARDGNFLQATYDKQLGEHVDLAKNGRQRLLELERREAETTGINPLKVKYNKVWGYFLEVTNSQISKVPERYIHRQTTTNNQRFSTTELMELERALGAAEANALARELELFGLLVEKIKDTAPRLLGAAEALAQLDVLCAAAELAARSGWCLPALTADTAFDIQAGRHPVVAELVDNFIANNCQLSGSQLWLITGPNMAGKSTFLRQQALITILAQMGFPVPAQSAEIGLVDKIFTRIGASDDLGEGQSTFMVEMVEAAAILNGATEKSLVILDEIGRGTATYDGLAIAWAVVEHLVQQNRCRALFATHYHELTTLPEQFDAISNHHAAVKEWQDDIVFLHEIQDGSAPGSFGVHVGKLAGLPADTVARATDILHGLEAASQGGKPAKIHDLPLFTAPAQTKAPAPKNSVVEAELKALNIDDLTPREALDVLYKLKEELK